MRCQVQGPWNKLARMASWITLGSKGLSGSPQNRKGHEDGNDTPPSLHVCNAVEVTEDGTKFVEQFHGSTVERQLDAQVATRAGLASRAPAQSAIDHMPQVVSRGPFGIKLSTIETHEITPVRLLRPESASKAVTRCRDGDRCRSGLG
jgi:hypothetical protein